MAKPVKPIPEGARTVTPHLVVRGASDAIAFYEKAFGAKECRRHAGPDGKTIMFAEIQIGDSRVYLNDEFPQMGAQSPLGLKGTPVTIHLNVEDVDATFNRAVAAGAKVLMPVADQFWGDRYGIVSDPSGHQWSMSTHIKDLTSEEVMAAMAAAFGSGAGCR